MFTGWQVQAQSDEIPERLLQMEQRLVSGEMTDEQMLMLYEWLMYEYFTRDMEKVRFYFRQAIAFAREKKPDTEQRFYARMGIIFSDLNQRDSATIYFDKAVKLLEGNENDYEKANVYELLGTHYSEYNDHENAINAYLIALDLNEKDKARKIAENKDIRQNIVFEVKMRINIATIRGQMLNHEKHLEEALKVKQIIDENRHIDFSNFEYINDAGIAEQYMYFNEYEKALPYIESSYQMAVERGDLTLTVFGLIQYSLYYQYFGDYHKALGYAKEALQIAEKQVPYYLNLAEGVLARAYIYLKDYRAALYHTERQMSRTEEDDYQSLEYVYSNLALIYAAQGDMKKASENLALYDRLKAKMSDEHMHNAIKNMEVKYEVEQREQAHAAENERQQAKIKLQNTRLFLVILGSLIIFGLFAYINVLNRKRNRELAETNVTKDKFFSIISHDLKNPAVSQRNAVRLLLDNAGAWDAAKLTRYYQKLLKSAEGHVNLIFTLLDWAQMQAGRMPYTPANFDLANALQSDIGIIRNMAENKEVALNVQMPQQTFVTGDCDMLATVVRNLLANAVKFTAKGGTVTLNVAPLNPPEGGKKAPVYTVSVADTGTGMTPEQIQILFKLDKQQSRKGTAGEEGTGLGLIVCQEMLEKHGSKLEVESEEGKGSRFWFEIRG